MTSPKTESQSFHLAELHSEVTRVVALLGVIAGLLALVLIRGLVSLSQGRRGEAWPFVALLAAMAVYEAIWLRFVKRTLAANGAIAYGRWAAGIFVESLLPTVALILQVHTSTFGPQWALSSPVVLTYLLFILLSTLHLNTDLSRLSGVFSAVGYGAVCLYAFARFPEIASVNPLVVFMTAFSFGVVLLLGGYVAGAVANQIRQYVVAALREADARAKIAAMEHDLGVARSIQQGLLPKAPPQIDGFDIAGWNQPADETGGDYFDWQALAGDRYAITIADVTGHGIGPAIAMAACRAYSRAGFVIEPDLRNMLNRLNRLLYEDLPPEKFVTLAAGVLDPKASTLQLISGGHGPLIFYCSAEDRFITYDAQGPPLGLLPQFPYRGPQDVTFAPGDMLVLVTDGFVEWANAADEDFGQPRVEEVIRAHRQKPAAAIISELHSAVVRFAGPIPQADDLTALVLKRL